jgi:solute carrier family 25 (peroxisomal adenine nucleotide transporter), member 17
MVPYSLSERSLIKGIYYFWYEWSKSVLQSASEKRYGRRRALTTAESMLAGLIAGSATVILTNPIWVVNTRETAKKDIDDLKEESSQVSASETVSRAAHRRSGFFRILISIIKTEGVAALWSGVIPALVLVINPIIQYTVFEQLKTIIEKRRRSNLTPNDAFLLGAFGKLLATGITYPYSIHST